MVVSRSLPFSPPPLPCIFTMRNTIQYVRQIQKCVGSPKVPEGRRGAIAVEHTCAHCGENFKNGKVFNNHIRIARRKVGTLFRLVIRAESDGVSVLKAVEVYLQKAVKHADDDDEVGAAEVAKIIKETYQDEILNKPYIRTGHAIQDDAGVQIGRFLACGGVKCDGCEQDYVVKDKNDLMIHAKTEHDACAPDARDRKYEFQQGKLGKVTFPAGRNIKRQHGGASHRQSLPVVGLLAGKHAQIVANDSEQTESEEVDDPQAEAPHICHLNAQVTIQIEALLAEIKVENLNEVEQNNFKKATTAENNVVAENNTEATLNPTKSLVWDSLESLEWDSPRSSKRPRAEPQPQPSRATATATARKRVRWSRTATWRGTFTDGTFTWKQKCKAFYGDSGCPPREAQPSSQPPARRRAGGSQSQ